MPMIDPKVLNAIVEGAELDSETAEKLRKFNESADGPPRGHGSPTPPDIRIRSA